MLLASTGFGLLTLSPCSELLLAGDGIPVFSPDSLADLGDLLVKPDAPGLSSGPLFSGLLLLVGVFLSLSRSWWAGDADFGVSPDICWKAYNHYRHDSHKKHQ